MVWVIPGKFSPSLTKGKAAEMTIKYCINRANSVCEILICRFRSQNARVPREVGKYRTRASHDGQWAVVAHLQHTVKNLSYAAEKLRCIFALFLACSERLLGQGSSQVVSLTSYFSKATKMAMVQNCDFCIRESFRKILCPFNQKLATKFPGTPGKPCRHGICRQGGSRHGIRAQAESPAYIPHARHGVQKRIEKYDMRREILKY